MCISTLHNRSRHQKLNIVFAITRYDQLLYGNYISPDMH